MKRIEKYNLAFDDKLMAINHYTKHQQMLPYVGEQYADQRVLIISESHYVPEDFKSDLSNWYEQPSDKLIKEMEGNTNTRDVIDNFFNKKGHRLFSNLNTALKQSEKGIDLSGIAWYNFYQKPAQHKKEFANPDDRDIKEAIEVFEGVIKALEPKLIVFVSKNSFGCLQRGEGGKEDRKWNESLNCHQFKNHEVPICAVDHPNSPWWNNGYGKENKTGKQRFKGIIRKYLG